MSYTLTQSEFSNLKRRLTRAKNSGNPETVMSEVRHAVSVFNEKGWPDNWPMWRIAAWDHADRGPFDPEVERLFDF